MKKSRFHQLQSAEENKDGSGGPSDYDVIWASMAAVAHSG